MQLQCDALDLSSVLSRLSQRCPSFKDVDWAISKADQWDTPKRLPAIYVTRSRIRLAPQRAASAVHTQMATLQLRLFVMLNATGTQSPSATRRAQFIDQYQALETEVLGALLGWSHHETANPWSWIGGDQIDLTPARAVYDLMFESTTQVRVLNQE